MTSDLNLDWLISVDDHILEPPNLWVDRLPAKYKDRGPHVIETPNSKGHAWIMEGQSRPSPSEALPNQVLFNQALPNQVLPNEALA